MGEVCQIYPATNGPPLEAEVVGFKGNRVLLMPLGEIVSIGPGCEVIATGKPLTVKVGMDLLGKVLDGLGKPMDESPLPSGLVE